MISIYCWNSAEKSGQWLDADALRKKSDDLQNTDNVVWIDLESPDADEENLVYREFFPIHPLTLEDITKPRREPDVLPHFPKVEEFRDYLFVVVNPLAPRFLDWLQGHGPPPATDGQPQVSTQLTAVLTHHLLITHHYELLFGIEQLRTYLRKHVTQGDRGPDYLFHLVLDNMVDLYAPVLDYVDEQLEKFEDEVLNRHAANLLSRLLELKRQIIALRKTLVYEREVLARLARGEFALIDQREMVYYRNVYDHLVRFTELTEASRDMASDLMQTHLAAVSNRLNEIMKVLTMISTVVLPMTLVAGVYGMNFTHNVWPHFEHSEWGFVIALFMMLLTGIGSLALFLWKRWL
jgi:magnesium transporter